MNSLELVASISKYPPALVSVSKSKDNWFGGSLWSVAPANGSEVSIHFRPEGYEKWVGGKKTPSEPWACTFDAADVTEGRFHDSGFYLKLKDGTTIVCGRNV